jgi:hypothetical protein
MMMGLAIAHHIREQVVFPADVIEVKPQYQFQIQQKFEITGDWGEEMVIV